MHLPEHGINDRLLERLLGLLLPDHVGERDGGAALDDGGFNVGLKVGATGWELYIRNSFLVALFSRCAANVIGVATCHSAVGVILSRGGGSGGPGIKLNRYEYYERPISPINVSIDLGTKYGPTLKCVPMAHWCCDVALSICFFCPCSFSPSLICGRYVTYSWSSHLAGS